MSGKKIDRQFQILEWIYEDLIVIADKENRSINYIVNEFCEQGIENWKKKYKKGE